jgi:hypothetical protein
VPFLPGDRVFVDESKARGYYIAAAAVQPSGARDAEKGIRALRKPGQWRIHFKNESDPRRRELLAGFSRLELRVTVYVAKGVGDESPRGVRRLETLGRLESCLGTRRRGIRLS